MCDEKTSVRVADGSVSKKPCKSVWLSVRPQHLARPVRIKFFIVSGGINLLGRWAICQLWPEHYASFKRAVYESSVVPEEESSDLRVATPVMARGAGSAKPSSTPQQGDVADIVECVATLSINVNSLARVARDMSTHVYGAGAREKDIQRPDDESVSSVTSRASTFSDKGSETNPLCSETVFGDFV